MIDSYDFGFYVGPEQSEKLFNIELERAHKVIIKRFTDYYHDKLKLNNTNAELSANALFSEIKNTKDSAALTSMAYNLPGLVGNNLIEGIVTRDRAAAWYEIRYQSNKNSLKPSPPDDAK